VAGQTVAMREGTTFSYFLTDNLGSVVGVTDSSGVLISETRYLPFGETRTDVGTIMQTDFGYTFQRSVAGTGLMDYKARMYDPTIGRFVQPDTLVPSAGSSQAWNRYAYVNNNPINFTDPTGNCAGYSWCYIPTNPPGSPTTTPVTLPGSGGPDGGSTGNSSGSSCDYLCQSQKRQDALMPLVLKGSNADGTWSQSDYAYYSANRDSIFEYPSTWLVPDESGLTGFEAQVARLASHYGNDQKDQFVKDFALLFGGVPEGESWNSAAFSVRGGPHALKFINGSTYGLAEGYLDSEDPTYNQSHHFAGLFFLGYFAGSDSAKIINFARDYNNEGDLRLGNLAADDGGYFSSNSSDIMDIVNYISALSTY